MNRLKIFFLLVMGFLSASLLYPWVAQATTISPSIIEITAGRGETVTQTMAVSNEKDEAVTYSLSAEKFIAADESGTPQFVSGGEDVDLAGWIKFPYATLNVGPRQKAEISFSITVPSYASYGGHYAAVFLTAAPTEDKSAGSRILISGKIGALVLLKVSGEIKEAAELAEFSTSRKIYSTLPVNFLVKIKNEGNVHFQPSGFISVKNIFGTVVEKNTVNDSAGNILPDQTRKFSEQWLPKNKINGLPQTFWDKYWEEINNFAIGRYTADLSLVCGSDENKLANTIYFWVLPWHMIVVNFLILITIVFLFYFLARSIRNHFVQKNKK